ncbi:hypothetical protein DFH07DRAFT_777728 [Mycena maculata]|uniref:Uncharacterized protein n=1 Tax=Mycena maculata TaxID=230809 RepID=A0AAD7N260_9AGAR|nr:hypothetical protein DFH07DRAFT_777728 [Mycena maculata]
MAHELSNPYIYPDFVTHPPLVPDPDFTPNRHIDPRYDNPHLDPRYDSPPEPQPARREEDELHYYTEPEHLMPSYTKIMFSRGQNSELFKVNLRLSFAIIIHSPVLTKANDTDDSDSENEGLVRTFEPPSETATREELYADLQLTVGRLMVENRTLRSEVAALKGSGKKVAAKGRNPLNYQDDIIMLGKKFGFIHEPWISLQVFTVFPPSPPPQDSPADIEAMFKSPDLYTQYLTCCLYTHVSSKYHDLVDSEKFSQFGKDFIKYLNAGRSSAVNSLKSQLTQILSEFKITNNKDALLYHPDDDKSHPPTAYPPIFYRNSKKNPQTLLLNEALPMALRCMLFGAASIKNQGTGKPQAGTLGYKWKLTSLTIGCLLRLISDVDLVFEATGKISKIPFQVYFHKYKKMLLKNAKTPGVRNILKTWDKIVFAGVMTTAVAVNDVADDSLDEAAMEAEFAAAMEEMTIEDIHTKDHGGDSDNVQSDGANPVATDEGTAELPAPRGVDGQGRGGPEASQAGAAGQDDDEVLPVRPAPRRTVRAQVVAPPLEDEEPPVIPIATRRGRSRR